MTGHRSEDPRPLEELPFARQLESDLVRAARRQQLAATPSPRRGTPVLLRRAAILVAGLVIATIIPVATSVLLSLFDDDGIPRATADLPVTGGGIDVVPMGEARGAFDVDLGTAPSIAQSVRVEEPTRMVAVEVSLAPPTVLEPNGTERFAPDGPWLPGTITVGIWQAGDHVDLDGEVELRSGFQRVARGSAEGEHPRQGQVRIDLDSPTVLPAGEYLVVIGFEMDPAARILRMSVGGALLEQDGSGDRYPDGQAFRPVDRGDGGLWFAPAEAAEYGDGLPTRGDLQLWLRVN